MPAHSPRVTLSVIRALWYRALEEEFGLAVESEDKPYLRHSLYQERQSSGDPSLDALVLIQPGRFPNQLWIVKKSVEMEI